MVFLLVSFLLSLLISVFPGGCRTFCSGRLCWMYWVFFSVLPYFLVFSLSSRACLLVLVALLGLYWAFLTHVSFLEVPSRSLSWSPLLDELGQSACLHLFLSFTFGALPRRLLWVRNASFTPFPHPM